MPTVMLTAICPNSCPWCFARSRMEEYRARGIREISWEDFLRVVDFYERSGKDEMVLLGGEPTLHSRFMDILGHLQARGFSILVATSGLCPEPLVEAIAERPFPNLEFSVNSTSYFDYAPEVKTKVDHFLRNIPHPKALSYTLTGKDLGEKSLLPLLDRLFLIMKFSLVRHLQFQIGVPGGGNRDFVPLERYGSLLELLREWSRILKANGFSFGVDCHCIPPCSLREDLPPPFPVRSQCSSFMIDIGPGLEIWPCFPRSGQIFHLQDFRSFAEVDTFFSRRAGEENLRYEGFCAPCGQRLSGRCDGGCRGFQSRRQAASQGFSP